MFSAFARPTSIVRMTVIVVIPAPPNVISAKAGIQHLGIPAPPNVILRERSDRRISLNTKRQTQILRFAQNGIDRELDSCFRRNDNLPVMLRSKATKHLCLVLPRFFGAKAASE